MLPKMSVYVNGNIVKCLLRATTGKLQARKEYCSHYRLWKCKSSSQSNGAALLTRQTSSQKMSKWHFMLYISRFKRKDMKNNGRYIGNENWKNVDRRIEFVCRECHLFIQNFSCFSHFCIFFKVLLLVLCSTLVWLLHSISNFRHFLVPERPLSVLLPVGCWLGQCTQRSHSCISPRRCMSDQGRFHHCTSESPFFGWSWFPDNMSIYVPSCSPLQNIWLQNQQKRKSQKLCGKYHCPFYPLLNITRSCVLTCRTIAEYYHSYSIGWNISGSSL